MSAECTTTAIIASNMHAYEKQIEENFKIQIQPLLQIYLEETRRPNPIHSIFDMSDHIEL